MNRKYIFISGGVISGVGKGIASASLGFLLRSYGIKVSMVKADPYLNIDAGTMNPLEHGETFVLEDGFETDMDMGHYERFTGMLFSRINSVTAGAIFQRVLDKERALQYDGKWVSIDNHVPTEFISWLEEVGEKDDAEVVIIEIGGTVGEMGQAIFLEANRIMKVMHHNDVVHMHVSYLPIPGTLGEMKSKPAQISVRLLNQSGINPDFIIARAKVPLDEPRREKLSKYCIVPKDHVISAPDIDNIYDVPVNFEKDKIAESVIEFFGFKGRTRGEMYYQWEKKLASVHSIERTIKVGIVGKYIRCGAFDLQDSYVSVTEALKHASWEFGVNVEIDWIIADDFRSDATMTERIKNLDGMIVPQGWGSRGAEGKLEAIRIAREEKIPYLGLCYGMQVAVIEFARNVAGLAGANSEEVDPSSEHKIIHLMEEQKQLIATQKYGGTIRLGAYPCKIDQSTLTAQLYKKYRNDLYPSSEVVNERHRHRYEFNNEYRDILEKSGLLIVGTSPDDKLVESIELPQDQHPFFVGTQYHPELKSQLLQPHPLFMGFIEACMGRVR